MRIFASQVSSLYARGYTDSQVVRALLGFAVREVWGTDCPEIAKTGAGKPYFPACADKHFSLSHSKSHVLVALSDQDVGADIETLREEKGRAERLFPEHMLADFGYLGGWTLRESVFKLSGQGSLRKMDIRRREDGIVTPFEGVCCRLYDSGDDFVASAACFDGEFPEKVEMVDAEIILSYLLKL